MSPRDCPHCTKPMTIEWRAGVIQTAEGEIHVQVETEGAKYYCDDCEQEYARDLANVPEPEYLRLPAPLDWWLPIGFSVRATPEGGVQASPMLPDLRPNRRWNDPDPERKRQIIAKIVTDLKAKES
jgi:hypothetical protein